MDLAAVREDVAIIGLLLKDIPARPVDLKDPNWREELSSRVPPVDEAGVAAEATAALEALLDAYESGDEQVRNQVRQIFHGHSSFSRRVGLTGRWTSAAEFRRRLIEISAQDQADTDPRDVLVGLWELCEKARERGIDVEPIIRDIASISGGVDHYGMGSTQFLIMRGLERH
jgi:hypothetical protein